MKLILTLSDIADVFAIPFASYIFTFVVLLNSSESKTTKLISVLVSILLTIGFVLFISQIER